MKNILFRTLVVLLMSMSVACSSTTLIRTTDPEAKIFVDDEFKGHGQYTHSDSKIIGSTTRVRLEKPGCEPKHYQFSRSEEFDAGACAGGVFLLVPFLWVTKYKPEHTYDFICEQNHSVKK